MQGRSQFELSSVHFSNRKEWPDASGCMWFGVAESFGRVLGIEVLVYRDAQGCA